MPFTGSLSNAGQAVVHRSSNFFVILEFLRKCDDEGFPAMVAKAFAFVGHPRCSVGLFQVALQSTFGVKFGMALHKHLAWAQNTQQCIAGFSRMVSDFRGAI